MTKQIRATSIRHDVAPVAWILRRHRLSFDPYRQEVLCHRKRRRTEMVNQAGGDKFIVNGKIQPKLTVRRRKYRFRILSTGPTKAQWDLTLIKPDGSVGTMAVVATDANFLEHPIPVDAGANAGNSNASRRRSLRAQFA